MGAKSGKKHHFFGKKPYKDLTNYPLFSNLDYWIESRIRHFHIACPLRERIFKDFLLIKFTVFKGSLKELAMIRHLEALTNSELRTIVEGNLSDAMNKYEKKMEEAGMPPVVLSKFAEWHSSRIKAVRETIKDICTSTFISDNSERVAVILYKYNTALHSTITDAEKTLIGLNGQLDSVVYKGKGCQNCKVCHKY